MRRNTKTMYEWRKAYRDKEGMSGSLLIGRKKPLCWRGDTRK